MLYEVITYMKITKVHNETWAMLACIGIFFALWADKGLGFVFGGLVVNPLGQVVEYYPTLT